MLKEDIINKFMQVLASVPQAQQDALTVELAKMIPATPDADVDWSIGSGYDTEKDEVGVTISLKIVPASPLNGKIPLIEFITNTIQMGKEEQLLDLERGLDIIINHIVANQKVTYTPALPLTDTIFAIHLRFGGEPSKEAKVFGEEKRREMKTQKETACL